MATSMISGITAFQRMAQVRAIVAQAIVEAQQLRDAITVPQAHGDRREAMIDLQRQLDNGQEELESVMDYFQPREEHIDQALLRVVEGSHR